MAKVSWVDDTQFIVKLNLTEMQKVRDLQHGSTEVYSDVVEKIIERGLIELTGEVPENRS